MALCCLRDYDIVSNYDVNDDTASDMDEDVVDDMDNDVAVNITIEAYLLNGPNFYRRTSPLNSANSAQASRKTIPAQNKK